MNGSGPRIDQVPSGWSGARGYQEHFAGYTSRYVDEVLDLVELLDGHELLDVAAGTGSVSVRAAERGARVTATDFSPEMVEVVSGRLRDGGHVDAVALVMDGQALDLPNDSVDVAVSMFGLMFFPDIAAGLSELRRVVRPGGRIAIGTWDLEGFPMHQLIRESLTRAMPDVELPPPPPPTWAEVGTPTGLATALGDAGFVDVEVRSVTRSWTFTDPARFFREAPSWSSPLRPLFDSLPADRIDAAAHAFAEVVGEEGGLDGDGGIAMTALVGAATVPSSG